MFQRNICNVKRNRTRETVTGCVHRPEISARLMRRFISPSRRRIRGRCISQSRSSLSALVGVACTRRKPSGREQIAQRSVHYHYLAAFSTDVPVRARRDDGRLSGRGIKSRLFVNLPPGVGSSCALDGRKSSARRRYLIAPRRGSDRPWKGDSVTEGPSRPETLSPLSRLHLFRSL